jgi:hypothetical protein
VNLDFLSRNLNERLFDGGFHVMRVTSALFCRNWIEKDLREELQTKRLFPQVKENSREISREHSIRQFRLIGIRRGDFVNQSQSLAFSETRIANY